MPRPATSTRRCTSRPATSHGVELMPASQFNAYTVLRQKRLVLTSAALEDCGARPSKK